MMRPITSRVVAVVLAMFFKVASVSAAGLPADWRSHQFGAGRAQVSLPLKFKAAANKSGTLEAQTAGPNGEVHLFFDLHLDAAKGGMKNGAETFVRDLARRKKLKIYETAGKVFVMEAGKGSVVDGAPVRNMHWQVGFGNNLVVMTFSVRDSEDESANVKQFFDQEMEKIVSSLGVPGA